jgi:hypothetical protein
MDGSFNTLYIYIFIMTRAMKLLNLFCIFFVNNYIGTYLTIAK